MVDNFLPKEGLDWYPLLKQEVLMVIHGAPKQDSLMGKNKPDSTFISVPFPLLSVLCVLGWVMLDLRLLSKNVAYSLKYTW